MLEDIAVLQQWKETNNPSHEVRDAMAKLAPRWKVPQKENGKKRPPGEVARDIEESLLDKAKVMFNIVKLWRGVGGLQSTLRVGRRHGRRSMEQLA